MMNTLNDIYRLSFKGKGGWWVNFYRVVEQENSDIDAEYPIGIAVVNYHAQVIDPESAPQIHIGIAAQVKIGDDKTHLMHVRASTSPHGARMLLAGLLAEARLVSKTGPGRFEFEVLENETAWDE